MPPVIPFVIAVLVLAICAGLLVEWIARTSTDHEPLASLGSAVVAAIISLILGALWPGINGLETFIICVVGAVVAGLVGHQRRPRTHIA